MRLNALNLFLINKFLFLISRLHNPHSSFTESLISSCFSVVVSTPSVILLFSYLLHLHLTLPIFSTLLLFSLYFSQSLLHFLFFYLLSLYYFLYFFFLPSSPYFSYFLSTSLYLLFTSLAMPSFFQLLFTFLSFSLRAFNLLPNIFCFYYHVSSPELLPPPPSPTTSSSLPLAPSMALPFLSSAWVFMNIQFGHNYHSFHQHID